MKGWYLNKTASDEELMTAYQQGHEEAFRLLYERYSSKVYGFLTKRLRDRTLVDDAFQGTFLKLHQARTKYDPTFPFAPWLFTVCRNVMVDLIRRASKASTQEVFDAKAYDEAVAPGVSEQAMFPELGDLPSNQKQALELRYLEDLSFEEIAKRLDTSSQNARQLVSRAVNRLKKTFSNGEGS